MSRGTGPFFGGRTCFAMECWPKTWACPLSTHHGFTLLEVLLAISLTAMVLVAVSMAIDFHLRVLGSGRADVEEAQLARAVLQRIAADLRSAILPRASDASGSAAAATTGVSTGTSGGRGGTSGGPGGTSGTSEIAQRDSSDTSVVAQTTPGLYGTADWLQVDISRLPRLDQLARGNSSAARDRTSEIKTVAYYVIQPQSDGTGGGLVCRELDRAVTSWAAEQGNIADLERDLTPFAPEVAAIQFRYFDGTETVDYWDMEERHGLPMAVEIVLQLRPTKLEKTKPMIYRLVVHLIVAEPTTAQTSETSGTTETNATSGSTTGGKSP
jgi:prepilin-type N-terminal cleavage/methylation domain-containing protein